MDTAKQVQGVPAAKVPKKRGRPAKSGVQYSSRLKKDLVQVIRTENGETIGPDGDSLTEVDPAMPDDSLDTHQEDSGSDFEPPGGTAESGEEISTDVTFTKKKRGRPRKIPLKPGATLKKVKLKLVKRAIARKGGKPIDRMPCSKCDYIALSSEKLDRHMRRAHKDDTVYTCAQCSFTCNWNREYYRHMKIHFKGPPYECDFEACDYVVERIQPLLYHRMVNTIFNP